MNAQANNRNSVAVGYGAQANYVNAIAVGTGAKAENSDAIAMGTNSMQPVICLFLLVKPLELQELMR